MKDFFRIVIKNKRGLVRSGWIIILTIAAFYLLAYILQTAMFEALKQILIARGDLNYETGFYSSLVDWVNSVFMPIASQILLEVTIFLVFFIAWRCIMKRSFREMGLPNVRQGKKELGVGMIFGIVNCSLVFAALIVTGQAQVASWKPQFSVLQLWWVVVFIMVGLGEEIMNRGFLMSTLRRTGNLYVVMLLPSVIFGLIHLRNPGVTFFSVVNIVLVGVLFSYIYIKSGNIWMCIGYHFTWNTFEGLVYGMPVSGLDTPKMIVTSYPTDNLINGGSFGIEGGILTTVVTLLGFLFVRFYYRKSAYGFFDGQ